jgi:threonine dehydratase
MKADIGLAEIEVARQRIAPYVRRTPLFSAKPLKEKLAEDWQLFLKLENLQITGSFKARGAVNKLLSLGDTEKKGLVTASGGNHGLGVAYAGWLSKRPTTIYLPNSTPPTKAEKIAAWGAKVVRHGQVWDEANAAALEQAARDNLAYFHPFADPLVIAGQGTIALEMLEDKPDLDLLLVAIGGGGLISGISLAATALNPSIKIIGIEPTGAPTLYESLQAGKPVELAEIKTQAGTLAPRKSEAVNVGIISRYVQEIVLVSDEEMMAAQRWLYFELGILSELAATAAIAALLTGKVRPVPGQNVGVVICGANADLPI